MTLKCTTRKARTRGATLRDYTYFGEPDEKYRHIAEYDQHLTTGAGGIDTGKMPRVVGRS
jgi:hypothetical protein